MNNKDLSIDSRVVWILVTGNLLLTFLGGLAKLYHYEISEFPLTLGLMMIFSVWIILLSDMIKHKIYKKSFWIISMFILPTISPIFYLLQRKRLIHLGAAFNA